METKDKVSVWAGILTLAVLQVEDRVNIEPNIYLSDWVGVFGAIVGYGIGFVIVYFITKILLERYFKGKGQLQPHGDPILRIALEQHSAQLSIFELKSATRACRAHDFAGVHVNCPYWNPRLSSTPWTLSIYDLGRRVSLNVGGKSLAFLGLLARTSRGLARVQ